MRYRTSKLTHAQRRATERYGLRVKGRDFASVVEQIQMGQAVKLGPKGSRTSVYLVTIQGQQVLVVYNRLVKWVITCLPINAWADCGNCWVRVCQTEEI